MHIENYFPIAVLHYNITNELANKIESVMIPEIEKLDRNEQDTQFTDFFENKIPVHELLPELVNEWIHAMREYQSVTALSVIEGQPIQYWTQDYKEGDTHQTHAHGIHGISGVYWVRANDTAGKIRLHNPNPMTDYARVIDSENSYAWSSAEIKPEKGKMILFPSYLKHEVLQSGPNATRTTIAFNFAGQ
jgi:hypothetical protein